MSTLSASKSARDRAERLWLDPRTPWVALAALATIALVVILRAGRGLFFIADEWAFILSRRGHSPQVLLEPHNEHPVTVGVLTYKVLLAVFGLTSYVPFQVMIALLHIATGVLLYVYARRRLGPRVALVPAALMFFLGAGWENVMWPFQVAFVGAVLFGLVALLALDAGKDWLVCAALVLACLSSALGLPFVVIAAVELLWDERRWRRLWVVVVPVVVVGVVVLGFGEGRHNELTTVSEAIRWAFEMAAGGFGSFGALGINWGRPLMVVAVIALVLGIRSGRVPLDRRLVALLTGIVAFWFLIALGRGSLESLGADTSRYAYMTAALVLVIAITALTGSTVTRRGGVALAAVTFVACLSALGLFETGPSVARADAPTLRVQLAALETARDVVAPEAQVDPRFNPNIQARKYFEAVDAFGSPARSIPEVRAASDAYRQIFDAALAAMLRLEFTPATAAATGSCTTVAAGDETELETGATYRLEAQGGAGGARLRRLATTVAADVTPAALREGEPMQLALPRDALSDPWHLVVSDDAPVRVCRAA